MKNTIEENDMEHSWEVSVVAHNLAIVKNRLFGGNVNPEHIAVLALYHETGEVITGDFATPIKYYNPGVRKAIGAMEEEAKKKIFNMLPEELMDDYEPLIFCDNDSEEYHLVKAADRICAYLKCLEELKSGNQEFSRAKISIGKDLRRYASEMPEVEYFLNHFTESFSLTLDELN